MTIGDFFWLDDAKFAQRLSQASDHELMLSDKHNVRKRKGGKLGAWVGAAQAPMTMGISLFGTGIGVRNRVVAKRRLEMIHAELERRGLHKHAEDWKDSAFAAIAVGAGTAVGMGFAPGAEVAAQGLCEIGATHAATHAAGVATSEMAQNIGSVATEVTTAQYTDPDTYFLRQKAFEAGMGYYAQPYVSIIPAMPSPAPMHPPSAMPTPPPPPPPGYPGYQGYAMPIPPAPYYSY